MRHSLIGELVEHAKPSETDMPVSKFLFKDGAVVGFYQEEHAKAARTKKHIYLLNPDVGYLLEDGEFFDEKGYDAQISCVEECEVPPARAPARAPARITHGRVVHLASTRVSRMYRARVSRLGSQHIPRLDL